MTDYKLLTKKMKSLLSKDDNIISNLSNASALINMHMENINWVGFYILNNDCLELGPFQGKIACTKLSLDKGVCAKAVRNDDTIIVDNVHNFIGHIACDSDSNSEIVVVLHKDNRIYGVLDIDSPLLSRFSLVDKIGLEEVVCAIENTLNI